jgi:hypothetical protein
MKILNFLLKYGDKIILFTLVGVMVFLFFFSNLSCCGYEIKRYDGIPEECNIMYNTMPLSVEVKEPSLVVNPSNWCKSAIERDRKDCLKAVYNSDRIETTADVKENFKKLKKFKDCMRGKLE